MTKNTTSIFLNRYGYHADFSLSKRALQDYLEAMKIGLRSHQPVSDLAMIPLIFFGGKPDTAGKTVIVIDVGGTNTRAALVEFDEQRRASISAFYHGATPGTNTKKMISKKEFFQGIVSIAEPILDKADNIGICFSYANRTLPDGDAVIAAGGKQIMVEDFIGSTIGVGIREAMRQKGLSDKHHIRIINDTAAVLLGGIANDYNQNFGDYIGIVLGTGINQAYIEPEDGFLRDWSEYEQSGMTTITDSWEKNHDDQHGATIVINQESGGFRGVVLNEFDKKYIATTYDAEIDWLEKIVSGYYLGGVVLAALQGAKDECLSKAAIERISRLDQLETGEVSKYIESNGLEGVLSDAIGKDGGDIAFALELINGVVERAAFYISVCITGTLIRGHRKNEKPTCIMVEGGLYEKLPGFKQKIDEVLREYIISVSDMLPGNIKYEFTTGENTTLFGTALAGLWE